MPKSYENGLCYFLYGSTVHEQDDSGARAALVGAVCINDALREMRSLINEYSRYVVQML